MSDRHDRGPSSPSLSPSSSSHSGRSPRPPSRSRSDRLESSSRDQERGREGREQGRERDEGGSTRRREGSRREVAENDKEEIKSVTVAAEVEMNKISTDSPRTAAAKTISTDSPRVVGREETAYRRRKVTDAQVAADKKKEDKMKKNIFSKKKRVGAEMIRGAHLTRLVRDSGLAAVQVQALSNEFVARVPEGRMTLEQFKQELLFDKGDEFGSRLFYSFGSGEDELSLDEFVIGVAKYAPRAKLETKIDACYDLFDLDKSGEVSHDEFTQVTTYSLKQARVGVSDDKLRQLIEAEWKELDADGSGLCTREEFREHMARNKEFVNALTIHVPWIQAAFRKSENKGQRRYLDTEPISAVLLDSAAAVGAKPEEAAKWETIFKSHYFTEIGHLKLIVNEDWTAMQLPRRLQIVLKEKLDINDNNDSAVSNKVARKVFKMRNDLLFNIRRKKKEIIWGGLYILGLCAMIASTLVKFLTDSYGKKYHDVYLLVGPSLVTSRVAGALLKYNFSLMLLPVCYRALTWLRSTKFDHVIPIDSLMFFHRYVGASLLLYGVAHTAGHMFNFYYLSHSTVEKINDAFGPDFVTEVPSWSSLHASRSGVTGWIMIISMVIMIPLAHEKIRRTRFNLFFGAHHFYMLIYICLPLHDGLLFGKIEIVYWLIPGLLVFILDRCLTIFRSTKTYDVVGGTQKHKGDVLELRMEKPPWFEYEAGHYTWVNCPDNSLIEWHPFTLTSSPDQDYISVHINLVGDWTKSMGMLCASGNADEKGKKDWDDMENQKIDFPRVRIDGPYGTSSGDVFMYSHAILVGGGIGVTPFVSILKSISYKVRYTNSCALQGVHFIWVAKSQENFQWFVPILADMLEHEDLRGFFKVSIYLTGTRHAINDIRLLGMSMLIKRAKTMLSEDLVTGLESSTVFGRPDFQKILLQANNEWAGNKVGVFFCGPAPLATSIKLTCFALNKANRSKKRGAKFHFKQEFF